MGQADFAFFVEAGFLKVLCESIRISVSVVD